MRVKNKDGSTRFIADTNLVMVLHNRLLPQTKFIEKYYSEKSGKTIKIKLLDVDNSYFNTNNEIVLSIRSLAEILRQVPGYESSLYYTLQMHEIGHALYTDMSILEKIRDNSLFITMNIAEDNRIEHLVSKWNGNANFKALRFITQDKQLEPDLFMQHFHSLALGLLRTVDNRIYVLLVNNMSKRPDLVAEILALGEKYKLLNEKTTQNYLLSVVTELKDKLEQLFEAVKEQVKQQQQPQQQQKSGKENSEEPEEGDEEQTESSKPTQEKEESEEEENEQGEGENEEKEEGEEDPTDNGESEENSEEPEEGDEEKEGGEGEDSDDVGDETPESESDAVNEAMDDLLNELERELNKLEQKNLEEMEEIGEAVIPLINEDYPEEPYERLPITVFDTVRRSSIRGGSSARHQGNTKELVMKRYMRREFVQNEKLFQKRDEYGEEKDKSVKVAFFLDISGSMSDRLMRDKKGNWPMLIETAANYLRSFYDLMHTRIDIKMYAFGSDLWTITRKELNPKFLYGVLEGDTQIKRINIPKDTEIIVITDGVIGGMSTEFIKRANFVVIGEGAQRLRRNGSNKVIETNQRDMVDDLNRATAGLAKILGGK